MKINLKAIGFFALLGVLFFTACNTTTPISSETVTLLSNRIKRIGVDWNHMQSNTNVDYEVVQSWVPEVGVRGRYFIAKEVMGKSVIEGIVGEKAFVSGPHAYGVSYTSNKDFGRYNPKFLTKLEQMLEKAFSNQMLVNQFQSVYDSQLQQYLRTFYLSYEVGANKKDIMKEYQNIIKQETEASSEGQFLAAPSNYLQETFSGFSDEMSAQGYDFFESVTCPGFWVRRSIDGTEDEFYSLLNLMIRTFDADFLAQY